MASNIQIPESINSTSNDAHENDRARTRATPPGNIFARLFKQFWYMVVRGTWIAVLDSLIDYFVKPPDIDFEKLGKRTNQVAVMTGGAGEIGLEIVRKLLQLDYTVILGVRNVSKAEQKIDGIRQLGTASGRVKLLPLELKSLKSVRRFASEVLASLEGQRIDLLFNHAGIMNVPYEKTEDNFESNFQVTYLSHYLLTNLLLPRIKETSLTKNEPCQVVNTSSHGQRLGRLDFEELETSKVYSAMKCYYDAKLCLLVHARTLERQFQEEGLNIHAYSVHPGEIPTAAWKEMGFVALRIALPIFRRIFRTTDGAANTVLYPALTPGVGEEHGGQYFESGKVTPPNPQVNDREIQDRLWERSLQLTRQE